MSAVLEPFHPITGEILTDVSDLDRLVEAYEAVCDQLRELNATKTMLASAIADMAPGETRTRRVRGEKRRVRVELPPDSWDSAALRRAWDEYPELRDQVLRIERVGVQLREWKKWQAESGPERFEALKRSIEGANRGATGVPRIVVEE